MNPQARSVGGWTLRVVLLASAIWAGAPALAQNLPRRLADLAQERNADDARRALRARGYGLAYADARPSKTWQYWWHGRDHDCVLLGAANGRVENFAATSETDCNQSGRDADRLSQSGRVAIAAARLLGVATLMHKSHERDLRRHDDVNAVAEFERGYRDGLNGQDARDRNRPRAYTDGYKAGQRKREDQAVTRPLPPGPPGPIGPGTPSPGGPVESLAGSRASGLEAAMQARGFTRMSGFSKGRETFSTWKNNSSRVCVQAVARDGRVQSVVELSEDNCP